MQTKYEEEKAAWEKEKEELVVEKKMPWFVKGEVSRSKDEIEDKWFGDWQWGDEREVPEDRDQDWGFEEMYSLRAHKWF